MRVPFDEMALVQEVRRTQTALKRKMESFRIIR
jgi:hypothetical protein